MENKVILRNERDNDSLRYVEARLDEDGDLVIEGQDLGSGVVQFPDAAEYEWIWMIKSADHGLLRQALGVEGDILAALKQQFSGPNAAGLYVFLKQNEIPFEVYSRFGD
ncbi:MAG: hypothetical protein OEZ39_19470 [Gammaproteobacteria bacterium]|nr:hypothetical protein [Gammaproteobacteria bacterium]MDH5654046.1 hypothetical protein [Gammaproteobacteria bacterium]